MKKFIRTVACIIMERNDYGPFSKEEGEKGLALRKRDSTQLHSRLRRRLLYGQLMKVYLRDEEYPLMDLLCITKEFSIAS